MGLAPIAWLVFCLASQNGGPTLLDFARVKKGGPACQEDDGWRDVQCGGPREGPRAESLTGEGAGGSDDALQNQLQGTTGERAGTQNEGESE